LVFRERDRLAAELKDYQKRLQTNRLYSESLEGMIDASREMISKLSSRVKHFESENFRLEHKLNVEQDKYEDRLLHLNKELAHVVQQNQELQAADNSLAELVASNDALKLRNDRLQRDNYSYSKSLRLLEDDKQKLSMNLKAAEGYKDAQRRNIADLDLSRRAAERDAKKKADESQIMERRFHQLSKKNAELNDQAVVNQ